MREELIAIALAVPLAFVVAESPLKRFALIGVVLFVLVVELLNTAIEKLADEVATAPHPGIRRVKDMGSAAVGIALLIAISVWLAAIGELFAFGETCDRFGILSLARINASRRGADQAAMERQIAPRCS